MEKVEGSIRINLLSGLAVNNDASARAGSASKNPTVKVIFDPTRTDHMRFESGDVEVTKTTQQIDFRVSSENNRTGYKPHIMGIEFSKPNNPRGDFAPSKVFDDEHTVDPNNNGFPVKVFGRPQPNGDLVLIDHDNADPDLGEQTYGYAVWLKLVSDTQPTTELWVRSPDPQIKNKPTTGGGNG